MPHNSTTDSNPLAHLVHQVGKYISRTARNLPPGAIPAVLNELLITDLYALHDGHRASVVFEQMLPSIGLWQFDPRITSCKIYLRKIDDLEGAVRQGQDNAIRQAAKAALAVERLLRELASETKEVPR